MSAYNLRAHHGMCLAFYQGKGYSQDFVENMNQISEHMKTNPAITITTTCDVLCRCCPNQSTDNMESGNDTPVFSDVPVSTYRCQQEALVCHYDQQVLDACGLHAGDILSFDAFHQLVEEHILSKPLFNEICGSCQWGELCHTS